MPSLPPLPVCFTVAAAALLALTTTLAAGQEARPLLGRDGARLAVAYDKTYAELSAADKARLRSLYERMDPLDEPPFPARGYGSLIRAVTGVQRELHVEGLVHIGVVVGADGRASQVKVYSSPDPRLTTIVANALMLAHYKPGLCRGAPCIQELPFRARFTLPH